MFRIQNIHRDLQTVFIYKPYHQVTVHYEQKDGAVIPKRVHTIVISVQHDDCISLEEQKMVLKEKVETPA